MKNSGLELINQCAKYAGVSGKKHIIEVLPNKLSDFDPTGLKIAPLVSDIAEISEKSFDLPKLRELALKNMSLHQMADQLNVSVGKVRYYLSKYNIVTDTQEEFRIMKNYFSATNQAEKAKAFEVIDARLKQIAKKATKIKQNSTYEDCLQDA